MSEREHKDFQLSLGLDGEKPKPKPKSSTKAAANTASVRVKISDTPNPKPKPATRKKPSVTTRRMTVTIPAKQAQPRKEGNEPSKLGPRQVEQQNPHLVQTRSKQTHLVTVQRKKVEPPKLGKRRSYRTPLSRMVLVPVVIGALVLCLAVVWYFLHSMQVEQPSSVESVASSPVIAITIEPGMTARLVSLLLEQSKVVTDGAALLTYFIEHNLATSLRSGSYIMSKDMDFEKIGDLLTSDGQMVSVTIGAGFTLQSIDTYLVGRGLSESGEFLKAAKNLGTAYGLDFSEGWLLAGSYEVLRQNSAANVAYAMFKEMLQTLSGCMDSPLLDSYSVEDLLIVASMIQAETQNPQEMKIISSVIHNRLGSGQSLGIDATTRYELNDWTNPIPAEVFEKITPYNTRRKVGLPPTGICSPGPFAIQAAFFPEDTPYFYYLHGLDKQLHPAVTYEQHKQNITQYLQ